MIQYTNYDPTNGAIYQSGYAPSMDTLPVGPDGSAWLYGVSTRDPETNRVNLSSKTIQPYTVPTVPTTSTSVVNTERDRRIAAGFTFPYPDGKVFQLNIPNITAALASATASVINGAQDGDLRWLDPNKDFAWIAMDNTELTMDARTAMMFGQSATAWNSSLMTAARAIKDRILAGETLNVTDNALWPVQTG